MNEPERAPGREFGEGYKYVALGMQFAGGILMFMAAGFGLDRWLHLMPVFTVTGTLAGAALSFLVVYRKVQAETSARKQDESRGQ